MTVFLSSVILPRQRLNEFITNKNFSKNQSAFLFFYQLAGRMAISPSRQRTSAMAESRLALITRDNTAGLPLAAVQRESRITPLFGFA